MAIEVDGKIYRNLPEQVEENANQIELIKALVSQLGTAMHYKGSVPTYADLPTEDNKVGDVWNVTDTGNNYAWDGEQWDEFGSAIDLSNLAKLNESNEFTRQQIMPMLIIVNRNNDRCYISYDDGLFMIEDDIAGRILSITGGSSKIINSNDDGYGLEFPDTTNYTANKEIATTESFAFKVMTSADFDNLTAQEKAETIYGGVRISGTITIYNNVALKNPIFYPMTWNGYNTDTTNTTKMGSLEYTLTSGSSKSIIKGFWRVQENLSYRITINDTAFGIVDYVSPLKINGKTIPNYPSSPSSPQVLTYGTDNNLSWGEGIFNVINASDISNNTLTQAQYDLITNGKPTLISGTFLNLLNPIIMPPRTNIAGVLTRGLYFGYATSGNQQLGTYQINEGTLVIGLSTVTQDNIDFNNMGKLNGKQIPAYPSNTGTFVLKCINGTLTWVQE